MSAPHQAVDFIIKNAPLYAKAKATRVHLEEFRKSKKALLMRDAMLQGIEAANAQEREAYAHPEYVELLHGLAAAIEEEHRLLVAAQGLGNRLAQGGREEGVARQRLVGNAP